MLRDVHNDDIIIYPTDTIYGVGCDATHPETVEKIRRMKQRPSKPLSVIAPSKKWIYENCYVSRQANYFLKKLPGPYTLILPLKNTSCVSRPVTKGKQTIGVRLPQHWICEQVEQYGKPFITTSVNVSGKPYMKHPKTLSDELRSFVDIIIDVGKLDNGSSIVYDCTTVSPRRIR